MVHSRALIIAAVIVSAACATPPPAETTLLEELRADPALSLSAPGAMRLGSREQAQRETLSGLVPAATGSVFGTSTRPAEVVAFYAAELARLGWIRDVKPIVSTREELGEAWCKEGRTLRLAFDLEAVRGTPSGGRSFSAMVVARRSACPTVLPSLTPFPAPTPPLRSP